MSHLRTRLLVPTCPKLTQASGVSQRRLVGMRPVAVITGGAQGLGLAVARQLVADGYAIALADLQAAKARQEAARIDPEAGMGFEMDVTSDESVAQGIAEVADKWGHIDALVTCAGIISRTPAQDVLSDAWNRELDVNLGGVMRACREVYPHLRQRPSPAIVNIGSVGTTFGLPLRLAYSTSKAGIGGFTRTLAAEWGVDGIRVNAVAPGYVDTHLMRSGFELGVLDEAEILARTPLRRLGQPDDIARAVSFLLSDAASFISGVMLPVDGGITISGDFRPREESL